MGQLRISKLMREFNTSIDEIVDFLNTQHLYPVRNPNTKIELPDNVLNLLKKRFGYLAYLFEGVKDYFRPIKSYNITYEVNGIRKTGYYSFILIIVEKC